MFCMREEVWLVVGGWWCCTYIWALAKKPDNQVFLFFPLCFNFFFFFGKRKFRPHLNFSTHPTIMEATYMLIAASLLALLCVDPFMIYRVFVLRATQTPFSMHFYALHNAFASEIYLLFHCIIKPFFFASAFMHTSARFSLLTIKIFHLLFPP